MSYITNRGIPDIYISHTWRHEDWGPKLFKLMDESFGRGKWKYTQVPLDYLGYLKSPKEHTTAAITVFLMNRFIYLDFYSYRAMVLMGGLHSDPLHKLWIENEIKIAKKGWRPIILVDALGNDKITEYERESADIIVKFDESLIEAIKKIPEMTDKIIESVGLSKIHN